MPNGWTKERKAKQSIAITGWSPWKQSTGPRSAEGKARVSRNAYRGALRAQWRQLSKVLDVAFREQQSDLLLPAIDRLEQLMLQNDSPSTALAAVCRILDLNGLVPDHKRTHKGHLVVQEELSVRSRLGDAPSRGRSRGSDWLSIW